MLKTCMECEHFEQNRRAGGACLALKGQPHPITGRPIVAIRADFSRLGSLCGPEGKLFKSIYKGSD